MSQTPRAKSSWKKGFERHDIYAYNPSYEWTAYKTTVGMALSYLSIAFIVFYISITTRDYIARPPELVSQGDIDLLQVAREIPFDIPRVGLRLSYTNTSDPFGPQPALENNNPYVRFQFKHVVMKDKVRVQETDLRLQRCVVSNRSSLCPLSNSSYQLLGVYFKTDYKFLEIVVNKCTNHSSCAPLDEINRVIASGELRVQAQISLEAQQFDVELMHAGKSGMAIQNRSLDYFAMPDVEVKGDIIVQARQIQKEQRYIGSPPIPETTINVLSYFGRDTDYRPRSPLETNVMTFHVRLADNVKQEEIAYWCPSILDLFGLWGAMMSFIASLSLGFIAMQYNKWHFHRHFHRATEQKRLDAQRETLAAMEFIRKQGSSLGITRNRSSMYQNLQTQYDALMIEPDIRLFETHHFDSDGRMAMSASELKFPTTPFGELRRLAIVEHGKKKRAAVFISLWYARHLIRKGFIQNEKRRRELFASGVQRDQSSSLLGKLKQVNERQKSMRGGHFLRQRNRKGTSSREASSSEGDDQMDEMEKGVTKVNGATTGMPTQHSDDDIPSGSSNSSHSRNGGSPETNKKL